jgi:hypothetical protein
MAQYAHLSTPDPEFQKIFETKDIVQPLYYSNPTELVASFRQFVAEIWVAQVRQVYEPKLPQGLFVVVSENLPFIALSESEYRLERRKIPIEGGEIDALSITPTSSDRSTFPLLLNFFGGGEDSGTFSRLIDS